MSYAARPTSLVDALHDRSTVVSVMLADLRFLGGDGTAVVAWVDARATGMELTVRPAASAPASRAPATASDRRVRGATDTSHWFGIAAAGHKRFHKVATRSTAGAGDPTASDPHKRQNRSHHRRVALWSTPNAGFGHVPETCIRCV